MMRDLGMRGAGIEPSWVTFASQEQFSRATSALRLFNFRCASVKTLAELHEIFPGQLFDQPLQFEAAAM